jgi:hypothetical protein
MNLGYESKDQDGTFDEKKIEIKISTVSLLPGLAPTSLAGWPTSRQGWCQ